jgi:hypothetical protein
MSAENLTRSIFDQRFITIRPFRETTGRIPIWRVARPHFELNPFACNSSILTMLLPALSAGQIANSGSRMNPIPIWRAVQGSESF